MTSAQYLFSGTYEHSLDDKGRLTIPSSFRKDFADGVVMRKDRDGSVEILPRAAWDLHVAKLQAIPRTDVKAQRWVTRELASALSTELDKQGRVLLSQDLKGHGQLMMGPVVITGALTRLKVWNPERWAELQSELEAEDLDGYIADTYQI